MADTSAAMVNPPRRRSIFKRLDELALPPLGRSLCQSDIDDAVAEAIRQKLQKWARQPSPGGRGSTRNAAG